MQGQIFFVLKHFVADVARLAIAILLHQLIKEMIFGLMTRHLEIILKNFGAGIAFEETGRISSGSSLVAYDADTGCWLLL